MASFSVISELVDMSARDSSESVLLSESKESSASLVGELSTGTEAYVLTEKNRPQKRVRRTKQTILFLIVINIDKIGLLDQISVLLTKK